MDIDAYRRKRLQALIDAETEGNVEAYARNHGQSAARLRQVLNPNYRKGKSFGEGVAKRLEEDLKLPVRYFDMGAEKALDSKHASQSADASISGSNKGLFNNLSGMPDATIDLSNTEPGPEVKGQYPLISWVQAGTWETIVDNFAPGDAEQWLDSPIRVSEQSFYLRVRGESMYDPTGPKSFRDGDLILVDPGASAEHGSFVIVRLDDESEATFKQLIVEGGRRFLKALNPTWPNRIFEINGNATICGVVKIKAEVM